MSCCRLQCTNNFTDISVLVSGDRGPCSKYDISIADGDFKGELEIIWDGEPFKVRGSIFLYRCTCAMLCQ